MKSANPLKRVVKPLVSPPVFDFWVQKFVANASWDTPLVKVLERREEARDSVTLVLKPNRHFRGFAPGQHINVTLEVDGVRHTRSYSLTNLPDKQRQLAITVKRHDGGLVSTALCRGIQVGEVLEISQAFGEMTVPSSYHGSWLMLAAGSGITPLMSMLRQLTAVPLNQPVTLLYWAQTRADVCFLPDLEALEQREPLFTLHRIFTRESELEPGEHSGRPDKALLDALSGDLTGVRACACGPAGFVEEIEKLLADRVGSFQSEAFTPSALVTADLGKVNVVLAKSGKTLSLPTDRPLLKALEDAGESPASGCRMGICNTCACGKQTGVTQDLLSGEQQAQPASALRLCINAARTDLVLEL